MSWMHRPAQDGKDCVEQAQGKSYTKSKVVIFLKFKNKKVSIGVFFSGHKISTQAVLPVMVTDF